MAVRLKDIADETGFSVNTVSLALQSSPRISESTRKTIQSVAKRLNYVPTSTARLAARSKNHIIALIVPECSGQVHMALADLIAEIMHEHGYFLQVVPSRECGETNAIHLMREQGAEGFFVFPMTPIDLRLLECVRGSEVPFVFLSYGKELEPVSDAVYADRMHASYIVTLHLLELGHRRILFMPSASHSASHRAQQTIDVERFRGHVKALNEYGLEYDPTYTFLCEHADMKNGYEMAKTMMRRTDATALYCTNDLMASGALSYLIHKGKRVPQDYSLVSNDSTEVARFATVPITASVYPACEIAQKATEIMLQRLEHPENPMPLQRIAVAGGLDVRESTGAPSDK